MSWSWRIGLSILLYILIYITAGMILQSTLPALGEFYKDKLPSISLMFNTQILRGAIFSFVALYFIKSGTLKKLQKAALLGLIFSVLGGISPLIPPNEFMPVVLRVGHGFEVGISNFIYGFLICLVLNPLIQPESGGAGVHDNRMRG